MTSTDSITITYAGPAAAAVGYLTPQRDEAAVVTDDEQIEPTYRFVLRRGPAVEDADRFARAVAFVREADLDPPTAPGTPHFADLRLPGPRVEREGRGTAFPLSTMIRTLIRYPYLRAAAMLYPQPTMGRPTYPPIVQLLLRSMARHCGSFDSAVVELGDRWDDIVVPELRAVGVHLHPGLDPITDHSHAKWRRTHCTPDRLAAEMMLHAVWSARLAVAIHDAECDWLASLVREHGTLPRDRSVPTVLRERGIPAGTPLDAIRGRMLLADGSVMRPPSEVHVQCPDCGRSDRHADNCPHADDMDTYKGSRASTPARARVHQPSTEVENKRHGPTHGFVVEAVSVTMYRPFTGVIIDVDMDSTSCGEIGMGEELMSHCVALFPDGHVQALVYDGAAAPAFHEAMAQRHGTPTVNYPSAKEAKGVAQDGDVDTVGHVRRLGGHHKGKRVGVHSCHMTPLAHARPDGAPCVHRLISEDGLLYATDTPGRPGTGAKGARRGTRVEVVDVRRSRAGAEHYHLDVDVRVPCQHGDFTHTYRVTDPGEPDAGSGYDSLIAKVRPVSHDTAGFRRMYGARNITESVFSRLERMFPVKDRLSAYGMHHQRADLLGAAIAVNALAWAHHVAYYGQREPVRAAAAA